MFTFGIFTTHVPYIAFVVFYAYFLLLGIDKATSGEIPEQGNSIYKSLTLQTSSTIQDTNNDIVYHSLKAYTKNSIIKNFSVFQRITRFEYEDPLYRCNFVSSGLFCRPPPTL